MPPNQTNNPYPVPPPAQGPPPPGAPVAQPGYGPPAPYPQAYPPQQPMAQPQPQPQGKGKKSTNKSKKSGKDERMSTQKYLMFSEIKDGIVVMRDGSMRMVIMGSALNFDLKSQQEQDAIEFSYQGFLNGLHFPIQIIVRSRKIDLDNYIEKLEDIQSNQQNQLLGGLMDEYIFNIKNLLEEINIMDKEFYVVVPYYVETVSKDNIATKVGGLFKPSDATVVTQTNEQFEKRKRDLMQRTNMIAQGLAQLGIRAAVLKTQELIELFYNSYNIDLSQSQRLIKVEDMTTPVVERGGAPAAPHQPQPTPAQPDDLYAAAHRREQNQATAQAGDNYTSQPPGGAQ